MWINVTYIRVSDKQLQKLDRHKVEKHRKQFEEDLYVMPIDVVKVNDTEYCISGNGRHRYFGAIDAGMMLIEVNVVNQ